MELQLRLNKLRQIIGRMESALVCFSGGVDSSLLLKIAHDVLGDRAVAFTAQSPALPQRELAETRALASEIGARHLVVATAELDDPRYAKNPSNRCYFCKSELLEVATRVCAEQGLKEILVGTTSDDLRGHRPGLRAAGERGARHPLVEADLDKEAVRTLAKQLELRCWDKPEMACLASRFPYGTHITRDGLRRVEHFEQALIELGFVGARVRFHDPVARLELQPEQIAKALDETIRRRLTEAGHQLGFTYVTLDLDGYRRGAMNEVLPPDERGPRPQP